MKIKSYKFLTIFTNTAQCDRHGSLYTGERV